MWLPEKERKLLRRYYLDIGKIGESKVYKDTIPLMEEIGYRKAMREGIKEDGERGEDLEKRCIDELDNSNNLLRERGLIKLQHDETMDDPTIELTIKGYDLGRKYNSWIIKTGLWFEEYKNHWLILILGFVAGILGALIVEWLRK